MDRWIQLHDTQTQSPLDLKIKKRSGKFHQINSENRPYHFDMLYIFFRDQFAIWIHLERRNFRDGSLDLMYDTQSQSPLDLKIKKRSGKFLQINSAKRPYHFDILYVFFRDQFAIWIHLERRNFRDGSMDSWIQQNDTQTQSPLAFKIKKWSGKYCKSALKRGLIILTFFITFSGTNLQSGSTWNGVILAMDRWIQLNVLQTQSPLALKIKKWSGKYCKSGLRRGLISLTFSYLFQGPICNLDPLGTAEFS